MKGVARKDLLIVKAYACTECRKLHPKKADALQCCVCEGCGHKFPGACAVLGDVKCGYCAYPEHVQHYRNNVKRAVRDLREAERHLRKYQKLKRKPRGSADRYPSPIRSAQRDE